MSESYGPGDAVTSAVDERRGPTAVSLAVIREGSATTYAAGRTSLGGARVGPSTRFDLASVTKVTTTLAVMRLRLDLDRPVRAVLPSFEIGRAHV